MIKTWIGDFCWDSWTEERGLRGMAKLEGRLYGDFWQILEDIDEQVMKSVSASLEGKSNFAVNDCLCAVRVYERYSFSGGNRLSLNVTLLKAEEVIYLSAITAGGSTALVFKLNTMGEEAFLDALRPIMAKYGEKPAQS